MRIEQKGGPEDFSNLSYTFSHLFPSLKYDSLPDAVNPISRLQILADMFLEGRLLHEMVYNCQQGKFFVTRFDPTYTDRVHFNHHLASISCLNSEGHIIPNAVKRMLQDGETLGGLGREQIDKYELMVVGIMEEGRPKGFVWYNHGLSITNPDRTEEALPRVPVLFPI